MILFGLLAAALVATVVLAPFWETIKKWLGIFVNKVQKMISAAVIGVKVFVKKIKEAIQEIARSYQKDELGQWHETTVTRTIDESEVPPEILARVKKSKNDLDISAEVSRELKLVV